MATATTQKKTNSAPAKTPTAGLVEFKAANRAAVLLKNASDPTRVRVLCLLAVEEHNVGEMCRLLELGQPGLSHHLALCRHGGIIEARRSGKENFYTLTPKGRILAEILSRVMKEEDGGR